MKLFQWRGRISKKAFVERFRAALQAQLPDDAVIEDSSELELRVTNFPQNATQNLWLGRAYQEFCKNPADIEEILTRWVRGSVAIAKDTLDLDCVIPVVKDNDWLVAQGGSLTGPADYIPWFEPYNSELIIVFAEYSDGLSFCQRSRVESLGIPLVELRERAFTNLRRVIKEVHVTGKGGEYILGAGGTIDSSLLLLDEVTLDPRIELTGRPLVGISDRDSFWIADGANPYAVFGIAVRVARHYRSEPYPISRQLFYHKGGCWVPLDPELEDVGHPIPNLSVFDIVVEKKGGGADLGIVIASPMSAESRSVFRLARKLDGYLQEINSDEWKKEHADAPPDSTVIKVSLHPDSDPAISEVLHAYRNWVQECGARLVVEKLEIGA